MQAQCVSYSIGDMSRETGLSVSTLRYYEKLGLLAPVPRSAGNIRQYGEADLERLRMLECLKNTGMALKDIRTFFSWCDEGDSTLPARYQMFLERRAETLRQISLLQKELRHIEYKCEFYRRALQYGSTEAEEVQRFARDFPYRELPAAHTGPASSDLVPAADASLTSAHAAEVRLCCLAPADSVGASPACPANPADCPMLRTDAPACPAGKVRLACVPSRADGD